MVYRVISLGAGVQSTTMALMAAHGEIGPMPDAAYFSDTQWEPAKVYDHLRWLTSPNMLPFPVHLITAGNLRDDVLTGSSTRAGRFAAVPWFTINPDGSHGMGRRQCTAHYKLEPIRRAVREVLDVKRPPPGAVEMWVGISTDEWIRMKPSKVKYITNRWPLIEQGMSRQDCLNWMEAHGYPKPPKSSCEGCPFHSNSQWRELSRDPAVWADLIQIDAAIRDGGSQRGIRAKQFMHPQRVPLSEVDLSTAEERGQGNLFGDDGFGNECEGMCGV